jgi:hypothetical protein
MCAEPLFEVIEVSYLSAPLNLIIAESIPFRLIYGGFWYESFLTVESAGAKIQAADVTGNPAVQIPRFGPNPDKKQIEQMLEAAAAKYGIPPESKCDMAS